MPITRKAQPLFWGVTALVAVFGVLAAINQTWDPFLLLAVMSLGLWALAAMGYFALPMLRARHASVDDVLTISYGGLVVKKPDGSLIRFTPNARWKKRLFWRSVEKVTENGVTYYVDRTRLKPL